MKRQVALRTITDDDRTRRARDHRPLHPTADRWVLVDGLTVGYIVPNGDGWSLHAMDTMCVAEGPLNIHQARDHAARLIPAKAALSASASSPTLDRRSGMNNRRCVLVIAVVSLAVALVAWVWSGVWLSGHSEPAVSAPDGERNVWALVYLLHRFSGLAAVAVVVATVVGCVTFWLFKPRSLASDPTADELARQTAEVSV